MCRCLLLRTSAAVAVVLVTAPFAAALQMFQLVPGRYERSLLHAGENRYYVLYVPDGYDPTKPIPLVVDLHGSNESPDDQAERSGFRSKADAEGFAVAYPASIDLTWNAFDGAAGTSTADDVGFIRAMVESIAVELPIDRDRIYATGHSAGGALTHRLACVAADLIAAAVPVSFSLHTILIGCEPSRPISVLQFHGLSDHSIAYTGVPDWIGGPILGAPESAASWAASNGCSEVMERAPLAGGSFSDIYRGCEGGVEVGLSTLRGGHFIYRNNDDGIVIADHAWDFLSDHVLVPEPSAFACELAAIVTVGALARWRATRSSRPRVVRSRCGYGSTGFACARAPRGRPSRS